MSYYSYALFRKMKDMHPPLIPTSIPIYASIPTYTYPKNIPMKKYEIKLFDFDKWKKKDKNILSKNNVNEIKARYLIVSALVIGFIGLIRYIDK